MSDRINNMSDPESVDWLTELRKLERYCNKKGFAVLYQPVKLDSIYFEDKRIVIGDHHSDEISLYCLLHEIGHHIIMCKKSYDVEYQTIYDNFSKSSSTYRITNVQEELDAWKEGLKLANRLNITVDRRKYEITKSKCISTYLSWVGKNKGKS